MKQINVKIENITTSITVVDSKSKYTILTPNELEMDRLARIAVKTAIKKAKICNKPIARYDPKQDLATIQ